MSTPTSPGREKLLTVLATLEPYLSELVIIGGWVPALHREFGGLRWTGRLSFTAEVEVLAVAPVPVVDGRTLEEVLRSAGFSPGRTDAASATWSQSDRDGAMIEFLAPHTGVQWTVGRTQPLPGHGAAGAIALADLDILAEYTTTIEIPAKVGSETVTLRPRVPTLGAYVVNKGATFPRRVSHDGGDNPKQAKDLLYLRDVAAGGQGVTSRVRQDVAAIAQGKWRDQMLIRTASSNLHVASKSSLHPTAVAAAGAMLAERENQGLAAATAEIRGYLQDLHELLEDAIR